VRKPLAFALALLVAAPGDAWAWGFAAHRFVNRKAIDTLPEPLRALFTANAGFVAEHSIDPDLWRNAGQSGEDPNHFLDMDAFGAYPFDIPRLEAEHLARHGADAAKQGRVPWRAAELYRELVQAFRDRDGARILTTATTLGHYVGDSHVPLHAILNYDGQLTGQKGLHARWESELFERFEAQLAPRVTPVAASAVRDPLGLEFEALLESYQASLQALASDRASAGPHDFADTPADDRYDDAYYTRLYALEGTSIAGRLQKAAERIGSLWRSAWEEAGRPALPAFRFPYVRRDAKLVFVSLDGASATAIDAAVARGVMPNLAALRSQGAHGRSLTALPAKTPVGHAALFTGTWPDRNGIGGIDMPAPGKSILTAESGFTSEMLTAEPLWVTAARQGLDVTAINTTQLFPFRPFLEGKRFGGNFGWQLTMLDGYQSRQTGHAVFRGRDVTLRAAAGWRGALPPHLGPARDFDITVGGARIDGLVYDDPDDPVAGYDSVFLATQKQARGGIVLKPRPPGDPANFASLPIRLGDGEVGLHFRLFSLAPDGSDLLLYLAEAGFLRSNRPLVEAAALKATGGFAGNAADDLYKEGYFGPPLWNGGDGTAESRYLESVGLVTRELSRLIDFGFERTRWEVLLSYLPFPDEFFHLWFGRLDPTLSSYDPALAARLRPFVDQGLGIVDGFVGRLREKAGTDAILAIGSDHGHIGVNRAVSWNVALQKAGLLTLTRDGDVDLFRTRAIYFPGNSGYFLVNKLAREQGIVTPEQEPSVLEELKAALGGLTDPDTGQPLVTAIYDPKDPHEPALGGPHGGDLYVDLAPGYYSSATLRGPLVSDRPPTGEHLYGPERPSMKAAFSVAGPGVAAGVDLGELRQIDVAPTLAALLGIDPPAQSTGQVLRRALTQDVGTLTQERRAGHAAHAPKP
jgi:predicted AlkP superfamily phosphohydrolase/phosphomutase